MMEWNAWIGQHEDDEPIEETASSPPPVISDLEMGQRSQELRLKASAFKNDSAGITLPDAKFRSDFTPEEEKLSPELIKGLFRANQKMMLSGASKSGKSFMLIELALCLASGTPWIGYECKECKVLYVNLEIAGSSFLKRIDDVSTAIGIERGAWNYNLKILNLRGFHTTLEAMNGALIGLILDEEAETGVPFSAVILDPIYKISDGEENSAKDVGKFCSYMDVICRETNCAVIFSHHHSKGDQGGKSAQDRASGSGVFARDADTMIDMIELDIDKDTYMAMKGRYACKYWAKLLDEKYSGWRDEVSEDDLEDSGRMATIYKEHAKVTDRVINYLSHNIEDEFRESTRGRVPLRMEFTLREFASPDPVNCFFRHPVHVPDEDGVLAAADPLCHILGQKREKVKKVRKTKSDAFYEALFGIVLENGFATYKDLETALKKSNSSIRRMVAKINDDYVVVEGGGKDETKIYFSGEEPEQKSDV